MQTETTTPPTTTPQEAHPIETKIVELVRKESPGIPIANPRHQSHQAGRIQAFLIVLQLFGWSETQINRLLRGQ